MQVPYTCGSMTVVDSTVLPITGCVVLLKLTVSLLTMVVIVALDIRKTKDQLRHLGGG
jgi:hypothetical protein